MGDGKSTTILQLSDLHFGQHKRTPNDGESLVSLLKKDLAYEAVDKPDCIVISGDLLHKPSQRTADSAWQFLRKLKEWVSGDNIIMVPGNHDIDWAAFDEDSPADQARKRSFTYYQQLFRKLYQGTHVSTDTRNSWFTCSWCGDNVFVLGLNSCIKESPEAAGIGFIDPEQIKQGLDKLKKSKPLPRTRIAVVHHHLVPVEWQAEALPPQKNPSLTLNAERALEELANNGFQIVLHGHQHQTFYGTSKRFRRVGSDTQYQRSEIVLISAGSANESGPIRYNLVKIEPGWVRVFAKRAAEHHPAPPFEYEQILAIPIPPSIQSLTVSRIITELESRMYVPFAEHSSPAREGNILEVPMSQVPSIASTIMKTSGYDCQLITFLAALMPEGRSIRQSARHEDILDQWAGKRVDRGSFNRVLVGTREELFSRKGKNVLRKHKKHCARAVAFQLETYRKVARRVWEKLNRKGVARDLVTALLRSTNTPPKEEHYLTAALFGSSVGHPHEEREIILGFTYGPRKSTMRKTAEVKESRYVFVFEPSPALRNLFGELWKGTFVEAIGHKD